MRTLEGQEFVKWYDRGGGIHSDVDFVKCSFRSCGLSVTDDPRHRTVVRNVRLINCEQRGSAVDTAIIENVMVDGLKTNGLMQTWGAVFKHTTLRGKIDRIMISPAVGAGLASADVQRAFDAANEAYYAEVDWALDISEAEFQECDLRRVPADLVRRDSETQVVIRREKAMRGEWRKIDFGSAAWGTAIEFFLERGDPDLVLVASKRHKKFRNLLDGLKKLRDAGVAERD
jgi:hypothetical protein